MQAACWHVTLVPVPCTCTKRFVACRLMDSTQAWLDLAVGMLVVIYPQVQLRGDMGVLLSQALSQRPGQGLGGLWAACQGMLQVL